MINTLVGAIDHEGGLLLFHDVKMPVARGSRKAAGSLYPPLPTKVVDFRHEFPVTNDITGKRTSLRRAITAWSDLASIQPTR